MIIRTELRDKKEDLRGRVLVLETLRLVKVPVFLLGAPKSHRFYRWGTL
jgi:hypothetical protein